jgi:1-acyl-sn-glycerol-3-phosphate acyltransferase
MNEVARAVAADLLPDVDAHFDEGRYLAMAERANAFSRRWFRFQLRGAERIPAGPCLFVANHSGAGYADVICLLGELGHRFGVQRRVVGLSHGFPLGIPVYGELIRSCGAVDASPEAARAAFARGYDALVYPGGDIDAYRGLHRPRDVVFGARRGYVRLALEMGVPVVPVATIGSHWTYLVPPGLASLGRMLGLKKRFRAEVLPVTVGALGVGAAALLAPWALPFAVAAAVVPNPARVTSEVLPAIDVRAATEGESDADARVERAHELVYGALQAAVRTMQHDG